MNESIESFPIEISVEELKQWCDEGRPGVLIDCREDGEFAIGAIEGAMLMPMSRWAEEISRLDGHRDDRLIVYCHHGRRSLQVVTWMRRNGYPNSQSVRGGIDAWSLQIDPTVERY